MKGRIARLGTGIAVLALTAGVVEVLPAGAVVVVPTVVTCGQTITVSTTLAADVGPCPSPGLGWGISIGASNITLDLNGKRVFGVGPPGEGPGIHIFRRTGVTVKNGTADHFDCGVLIEGGSGNTVSGITAEDNIGRSPGSVCGDGIAIESSTGNLVVNNTARRNGPFSGIGVYSAVDSDHPRTTAGTSSGNKIDQNTINDNVASRNPLTPWENEASGLRLEPNSPSNTVSQNLIVHNGIDGIQVFGGSNGNQIQFNTIMNNGLRTCPPVPQPPPNVPPCPNQSRRGSGILLFNRALGNGVSYNYVTGNSDNGIVAQGPVGAVPGAQQNRFVGNTAFGNAALPPLTPVPGGPFGGPTFDLQDRNGNCTFNQWYANTYGTAFPDCTKAGGTLVS